LPFGLAKQLKPLGLDPDEDGSNLWLNYKLEPDAARLAQYRTLFQAVRIVAGPGGGDAEGVVQLQAAAEELSVGLSALTGANVTATCCTLPPPGTQDPKGTLRVEVGAATGLGAEGYAISHKADGGDVLVQALTPSGCLNGAFGLLSLLRRGESLPGKLVPSLPAMELRVWDLWDNLGGSIERGYGGLSLIWPMAQGVEFGWGAKPAARVAFMARILKSAGLNGIVLNNVNACGDNAQLLNSENLGSVAATVFPILKKWGLTVYVTPCYAAPMLMGKTPLKSVDPLDPKVIAWWKAKADEIYTLMPSFGGFLVKADAEGNLGPLGYNRTEADGANLLARALGPHRGIVMWR
jgi:alpha-glucuronidase